VYRSGAGHPRQAATSPDRDSEALQARGPPKRGGASVGGRNRSAIHNCGLPCGRIRVRRADIQVNDAIDLWQRCTETLREQVPEAVWQTSLVNVSPNRVEDHDLVLNVPGSVLRDRIEARYLDLIAAAASEVAEHPVRVILEVGPVDNPVDTLFSQSPYSSSSYATEAPSRVTSRRATSTSSDREPRRFVPVGPEPRGEDPSEGVLPGMSSTSVASGAAAARSKSVPGIDPHDTFDAFVIGSSNRFAHAAALSVAEDPGHNYNPLFIHGGAGLGKTHLLHAIGNYVCSNFSRHRVKYITTEAFMNEFVYAIRSNSTMEFKRRYREECDVLLVDDVQFMAGKEQLQEEFFHTFNQLFGAKKQIVITSDRPPKLIATLEDRLRSRFASGLTTDVQPPELETRLAILLKRVEDESLYVGHDVLELIATHVKDNIRELDGALTRVAAYGALYGHKVTREMAESVLSDIIGSSKPRTITVKEIMDVTAETFGVTVEELIGPSRRRPLVAARQICMYVVREMLPDTSFPTIAREFGDRDHTTVMHAVKKIRGLMDKRLPVYEQTTELMRRIRAGE
jgi:chromosomal replication initiator protein